MLKFAFPAVGEIVIASFVTPYKLGREPAPQERNMWGALSRPVFPLFTVDPNIKGTSCTLALLLAYLHGYGYRNQPAFVSGEVKNLRRHKQCVVFDLYCVDLQEEKLPAAMQNDLDLSGYFESGFWSNTKRCTVDEFLKGLFGDAYEILGVYQAPPQYPNDVYKIRVFPLNSKTPKVKMPAVITEPLSTEHSSASFADGAETIADCDAVHLSRFLTEVPQRGWVHLLSSENTPKMMPFTRRERMPVIFSRILYRYLNGEAVSEKLTDADLALLEGLSPAQLGFLSDEYNAAHPVIKYGDNVRFFNLRIPRNDQFAVIVPNGIDHDSARKVFLVPFDAAPNAGCCGLRPLIKIGPALDFYFRGELVPYCDAANILAHLWTIYFPVVDELTPLFRVHKWRIDYLDASFRFTLTPVPVSDAFYNSLHSLAQRLEIYAFVVKSDGRPRLITPHSVPQHLFAFLQGLFKRGSVDIYIRKSIDPSFNREGSYDVKVGYKRPV